MLLSLPTELIEHIVRLSIPSEYSSATYLERQDTLRAICLVNRELRDVAQPVLQEVVRVKKEFTVRPVQGLFESEAVRVRIRGLAFERWWPFFGGSAAGLVALRDVRLYEMEDVDLSLLEHLPSLRNLVLSSSYIISTSLPRLPALTDLTWRESAFTMKQRPLTLSLSIAAFPALRNLSFFMDCEESYAGDEGYWPLEVLPEGVSHLDTLILSHASTLPAPLLRLDHSGFCPAVMGEACLSAKHREMTELLQHEFRHIRFVSDAATPESVATILSINFLIRDATFSEHLQLLYLPTIFRPSEQHSAKFSSSLSSLFNLCASRKIELDFEDRDGSPGGSLTSPKFAAYVRRMKETDANKGEEKGKKKGR